MSPANMVAACPSCGARYRIEAGRLRPEGVRLRCSRCSAVFRVTPPARSAPAPASPGPIERERLVLVADADVAAGKQLAGSLADWGLSPLLVHDGVEAILTIQRVLPRVVVLDAALPKMFGFQICELMKRNESLREIQVVLVGAVHDEHHYRREPSELYGADAYVERPQLPEALRPILRGFGLGPQAPEATPPPPSPPPPERPAPPPLAAPAPEPVAASPVASPAAAAPVSPEVAEAERLARIIVSDVVLYSSEKFGAGVRDGNVAEVLAAELEEGRALFERRVGAEVRLQRDFLLEELLRVARARGMT